MNGVPKKTRNLTRSVESVQVLSCETWGNAVNNAFIQKAGYGNAAKFTTRGTKFSVLSTRMNSESWLRAGNPGRDSRKTDCTETSILAP